MPCFQNRLLQALAPSDLSLLVPMMELVPLTAGTTLLQPQQVVTHVHFLESGLLSVLSGSGRTGVEVGLIGREGLSGLQVALDGDLSPRRVEVRVGGSAYRIPSAAFRSACDVSSTLHRLILRYAQYALTLAEDMTRSHAISTIETRLARWLLAAHDRLEDTSVAITHEALSLALGVRRPGVTVATHVLEGKHLIRARRGRIEIRDRAGLQAEAGPLYGFAEAELDRLVPLSRMELEPSASALAPEPSRTTH